MTGLPCQAATLPTVRHPFCLVVDWVAATIIAVEIVVGVQFNA
jgi:hypothetical protein